MEEGFGSITASGQPSIDNFPIRDIPDLPLSNPLRETFGLDFQLGLCGVTEQEAAAVATSSRFIVSSLLRSLAG